MLIEEDSVVIEHITELLHDKDKYEVLVPETSQLEAFLQLTEILEEVELATTLHNVVELSQTIVT